MNTEVNVYLPMYMSDLRHIHDSVFSSLKMEGIRFSFWLVFDFNYCIYVNFWIPKFQFLWSCAICDFLRSDGWKSVSLFFQT
jgi:hypothetical protein